MAFELNNASLKKRRHSLLAFLDLLEIICDVFFNIYIFLSSDFRPKGRKLRGFGGNTSFDSDESMIESSKCDIYQPFDNYNSKI